MEVLGSSGSCSQTPDEDLLSRLVNILARIEDSLTYGKEPQDLLDVETVARRLSCSVKTVENLIRSGHLQSSIMPGTKNARRISREQLARYLELHNNGF